MNPGIVSKVRKAGVTGSGGHGTHLSLGLAADTVIANATDREPLARADRELVCRYPNEVLKGLRLAMQAVGANRAIVAVGEDRSFEAITAAAAKQGHPKINAETVRVPAYYPAGDASLLTLELTGRSVPAGGKAQDVGVVVLSARSLLAIAEAERDQPSTHQLVSIMGAVKQPLTAWVPRGIALSRLLAAAGGPSGAGEVVLMPGGPMRGGIAGAEEGLRAGSALLAVLPADHPAATRHALPLSVHLRRSLSACENCQQCTALCPQNLIGHPVEPHKVMRAVGLGLDHLTDVFTSASYCSGCGLCSAYGCPVDLSPSIVVMGVRAQLEAAGYRPEPREAVVRAEQADRRVPLERLLQRLDLARYDVPAPITGTLATDHVRIALISGSGVAASPIVRDGHKVKAGQRIADVPEGGPGVPLHASITGSVRLAPGFVEIRA